MKLNQAAKKGKDNHENLGGIRMATQIAPTPTVRGRQAISILNQLQQKKSKSAELGAKKILEMFDSKK